MDAPKKKMTYILKQLTGIVFLYRLEKKLKFKNSMPLKRSKVGFYMFNIGLEQSSRLLIRICESLQRQKMQDYSNLLAQMWMYIEEKK